MTDLRQTIADQEVATRVEQERRDDLRDHISIFGSRVHSIEESLQAAAELADRFEQEKQSQALWLRAIGKVRKMDNTGQHLIQELDQIRASEEKRQQERRCRIKYCSLIKRKADWNTNRRLSLINWNSSRPENGHSSEIGRYEAKMSRIENQMTIPKPTVGNI